MTLMVVAHPIPGFNGRVFADEVAMAFVGGFAVANVPTGVQADLTARGFTLNATPGTNYGGKYVLDADLDDPESQTSTALRATLRAAYAARAVSQQLAHAHLSAATSGPRRIVFTGDSTMVGVNTTGLTDVANRIANRVMHAAQATYPSGLGVESDMVADSGAFFSIIPTAAGVQGFNAGSPGTTSANYLTDAESDTIAAMAPCVIVHQVGTNDLGTNDAATYKANLAARIAYLDARLTTPCTHVLVRFLDRMDANFTATWDSYGQALDALAAADPTRRIYADAAAAGRKVGTTPGGSDPLGLLSTDDLVHPTDRGGAFVAGLILDALRIPRTGPAQVKPKIMYDNFSARGSGSTLGTSTSGHAWTQTGTWSVGGGYATGAGTAFLPASQADVDLTLHYQFGANATDAGIAFNAADASNLLYAAIYEGTPAVTLVRRVAGADSVLTQQYWRYGNLALSPETLRVVTIGPLVRIYTDGTLVLEYVLSAADQTTFKGNKLHGVRMGTTDTMRMTAFDLRLA